MRKILAILAIVIILTGLYACQPVAAPETVADEPIRLEAIAGITAEEIEAIEALRTQGEVFEYGALLSTESFVGEDGAIAGFTAHLCRLFTSIFGIEFVPRLYDWDQIIAGLDDGSIDFSGDLIPTEARRKKYIMSDAIAERSINIFTLKDAGDIKTIAKKRLPRLGFLTDSVHLTPFNAVYKQPYELVYVDSFEMAAEKLGDGSIDGFINESVSDTFFEDNDYVESEEFFPLTYIPVSLTTQQEKFAPVVSVVNKFLRSGGNDVLAGLYTQGALDYRRHHLFSRFTQEEKDYIAQMTGKLIPVAWESDNYPICFYNKADRAFEGIAPDVMAEIAELTGLTFEPVTGTDDNWPEVFATFSSGKAAIVSELLYSEVRGALYLWASEPYCSTSYALLSRSDYPDIEIYQVLSKKVGVTKDSAYEDIFSNWFPSNAPISYDSTSDAFEALEKGEIDLMMATENLLLSQTNYYEKPGFKVNIRFNYPSESKFGFHASQRTLRGIVEKAQAFTKSEIITRRWISRVFDYSGELARNRVWILMLIVALMLMSILMMVAFLWRNRVMVRRLEETVAHRTHELEVQTTQLSTIYNAIPDLVFCKDMQGAYTACNPSFESFTGLSESEIIGKTDMQLFETDDGMARRFMQDDLEVIRSREIKVVEEPAVSSDGTQRLLETIKIALVQNGNVTGMMGISRDITQRKAIEEAAQVASRAKSSFLARMSHEIRTPLNAIIGMTEIIKASLTDSKILFSINQILTSSHHLLGIINDVLDMSKIESDKLELSQEAFDLRTAFGEVAMMMTPKCNEKSIRFEATLPDDLDLTLVGDKLRINQVLINLLGNAVKFTDPNGTVGFHVDLLEQDESTVKLGFRVTDSGIGMTQDQISRLFSPFEQADSTIASRFGGTGLGLSISKTLIQMMGGDIRVESEYGVGSAFCFDLTFEKGTLEETIEDSDDIPDLAGVRLLLVEDIEINRYIMREILAPTNIMIDEAENGQQAVEMFQDAQDGYYQLILMDVQMPVMDGYKATRMIRTLDRADAKDVPIIAMTANAYKEDVEQALNAGMNGHLAKPVDIAKLMRALRRYGK